MDTLLVIADRINKEISDILQGAINGFEPKYKYDGYIRWGLVEKDIHEIVTRNLVAQPDTEEKG